MKKRAVGTLLVLIFMLAACGPGATTTTSTKATTTAPKTTVQTTGAPTAPQATTKPAEKPIYGGTLNLVMISDITSWDYGLTFC